MNKRSRTVNTLQSRWGKMFLFQIYRYLLQECKPCQFLHSRHGNEHKFADVQSNGWSPTKYVYHTISINKWFYHQIAGSDVMGNMNKSCPTAAASRGVPFSASQSKSLMQWGLGATVTIDAVVWRWLILWIWIAAPFPEPPIPDVAKKSGLDGHHLNLLPPSGVQAPMAKGFPPWRLPTSQRAYSWPKTAPTL